MVTSHVLQTRASTTSADSTAFPGWRELASKARVYRLVRTSGRSPRVELDSGWEELVARVERLDPFSTLFRMERLGHDITRAVWNGGAPPSDLFAGPRSRLLPERALVMLHAGMGLCVGDRMFASLPRRADDATIAAALGEFLRLCRDNSRPGYEPPAFEPLGVMIRLFNPRTMDGVVRAFAAEDREPRRCFWHGVGRAIYFLPRHAYPGATARALERCRREPVDEEARTEALSGFFYAAVMVNLRQPAVIEALLTRVGLRDEDEPIVAGAVVASLLARHHTTPHDPAVPALLAHRPSAEREARWRRLVGEPAERALRHDYRPLIELGLLPQLARHHGLADVAALTRAALRDEARGIAR